MKELVKLLSLKNETISSMESCTGGAFAFYLTNEFGSSEVFSFGAVTYANNTKIKMGVDSNIINEFTVYSKEVARDMAKKITSFSASSYGIGITGRLNVVDKNNIGGNNSKVFMAIYDVKNDIYLDLEYDAKPISRYENKKEVINIVVSSLIQYIKNN